MIVPIKHTTLICVANEREETIEQLRSLGAMHVNFGVGVSELFKSTQTQLQTLLAAMRILQAVKAGKVPFSAVIANKPMFEEAEMLASVHEPLIHGSIDERATAIVSLCKACEQIDTACNAMRRAATLYAPFGSFDTALLHTLATRGVTVQLCRYPDSRTVTFPEGATVTHFASTQPGTAYAAVIGEAVTLPPECEKIPLPPISLQRMMQLADTLDAALESRLAHLREAAGTLPDFKKEAEALAETETFATAVDSLEAHGAVAWLTGWIPEDRVDDLRASAHKHNWGLLLRDPKPDEFPPTLLRPPRGFRAMTTLFQALGIAPSYTEADVSVPFFAFFSIFFAMLVGDGGYGAIILAATIIAWRKFKQAPSAPFILLTVFSVATIIWGVLSNTWFGAHPACLDNVASLWLNDENLGTKHMMLICFTLAVMHLSIARIWNAIALFPKRIFLAQIGWLGVVWFMFALTCSIVGIFSSLPQFMIYIFGTSVVLLVAGASSGIECGMLVLNIMGALGDIISYVRLFAVGLASVKVAENFNAMAVNNDWPLWLKIPAMILILLIGHGLNFMMAGLSILVHAVRLNTLEFSNHKGITWAGVAFKPFRRNTR